MRAIHYVVVAAFIAIISFIAITQTACNKDACAGFTCGSHGVCNNGICTCATGFEGRHCDTGIINTFSGTWTGTDACNATNIHTTLYITAANNLQAYIIDSNHFGNRSIILTDSIVNIYQLIITDSNADHVLNGVMSFQGNAMQFRYTYIVRTDTQVCVGNYTR